ncbi:MAG: hypothetical protein ACOYNC_17980 [Bacteroidales bacterium]
MKHIFFSIFAAFVLLMPGTGSSQEILQWRGINRDGIYNETGLLKAWPAMGPELIWEFDGLGNGYGSPVITKTKIFINGEVDTISYLFALDLSGKYLWKARYGKEWVLNYPGSRSTPTVVDDLVYVKVACPPDGDRVGKRTVVGESDHRLSRNSPKVWLCRIGAGQREYPVLFARQP